MPRARVLLVVWIALVASVSWFAREAQNRRVELPDRASWFSTDPDTQYHVRRVERALDEGAVAQTDARLNAPRGSAIPWPPYYSRLLATVLGPCAPSEGRAEWLERAVASAATLASVLGSVLALLVVWRIAGAPAGVAAGLLHALNGAAIEYGKLGNGDHHAFVSLASGAVLALLSLGMGERCLQEPRRGALFGTLAGAVAGLALGSWVATLILVGCVQFALVALLFVHARRALPGLGALALCFHVGALLVALPAIVSSPWNATHPWIVVNLSWFHLAYLAAGALVFAPLAARPVSVPLRRALPAGVAAVALAALAFLAWSDAAPARGVREGLEWVSRVDSFMARIGESAPLVRDGELAVALRMVGFAAFVFPLAWLALVRRIWRGELALLPWAVASAVLAIQALSQARFAEGLALPLAVVVGIALGRASAIPARSRVACAVRAALPALVAVLLGWPALARSAERWPLRREALRFERPATIGARLGLEWIGLQPQRAQGETVLALWSHGHALERLAGRGSLATNFGSYVGEEGFRASPELLLAEDELALVARMDELRVRYALVDSDLPNALNTLLDGVDPARRARHVEAGSERGGNVRPEWFLTFGARAMFDGAVFGPLGRDARPLARLRLVWVAPLRDPARALRGPRDLAPAAWVWERVAGARVEARGASGQMLEVALSLAQPGGAQLEWRDRAPIGEDGVARLVVPYATEASNGACGAARLVANLAGRALGGSISERAVLEGETVLLR
ncbi:MAG: hypothetical protein FJ298_06225 [Planctomycetes bacterium]|nr:hypothetical protein [Planctomycetota bacterium]